MPNKERLANGAVDSRVSEHEARRLLTRGEIVFDKVGVQLRDEINEAKADEEEAQEALDASIDQTADCHTPEAREKHLRQAQAQKNLQAQLAGVVQGPRLVAALVALAFGLFVLPAVEYSMFYRLFSGDFANEFGELVGGQRNAAALYALQAIIAVVAFKLIAVNARRTQWLAGAAFLGSVMFVIGAVLKHANDQFARAQTQSSVGIDWSTLPGELAATESLFGAEFSAPMLALGFFIVPLVSAVLIGWGWSQFKGALEKLAEASLYRRNNAVKRTARRKRTKGERKFEAHEARREVTVTAPLNEVADEIISNARETEYEVKKLKVHGTNGHEDKKAIEAMNAADLEASATIEKLGNGFVKDAFARWQADQRAAPP